MSEQQTHLQSALEQQKVLASEIQELNNSLAIKREVFVKLQGVVEYLTQLGYSVPEETVSESAEEVDNSEES